MKVNTSKLVYTSNELKLDKMISHYLVSGAGGVETRDTSSGVLSSEVMIAHTGPEHAGEYRCLARNLYGSDELIYRLFVKGKRNTNIFVLKADYK